MIWRIGWVSGFKTRARKFIRNHDTIYQHGRSAKPLFNKRYLPYPEGYVRRDGKPPTGKGIPLEDTWNCSAADRLDSIQIMSFSREKVGQGDLTQKNENLLERILLASTGPGDWVLDPFLGSGTTAATAHKLGRRWVGIEQGPAFEEVALPRMRRVLAGDRYGISAAHGWSGGGAFEVVELEDAAAVLARLLGQPVPAATEPVASLIHLGGLTLRRAWRCGDDLVVAAAVPDGSPRVVVGPGADRDELSAVVADARRWAQPSDPDRVPTFAFGAAFDALEGPELRSGDAALAALLAVERTVGVVDTMPA